MLASGCGGGSTGNDEIVVAAAASLQQPFEVIGNRFEHDHPGTTVTFTFDSSATLADQIDQGAPADVFASADEASMRRLQELDRLASSPRTFATNRLAIIVPPGNPEGVEELDDLPEVGALALCDRRAPCGVYAERVLDRAGTEPQESSVTRTANATATLTAVTEGDADAAIVYVTDARSAGDAVETITIPVGDNVVASYPIAVVDSESRAEAADAADSLADEFVDFVLGSSGRRALADAGFRSPT